MADGVIEFFPFFLDVLEAFFGDAAPFLHEIDGFIAEGDVLQGIFLELIDLFPGFILPFAHHVDVGTHVGRHAVFQPALGNAAQAVRDADGNRDLDGAERNDRRQQAAGDTAADGAKEGDEGPFTQFDVIDSGNAADQIDFVGHEGHRPDEGRDDDGAGAGSSPAAQHFDFHVFVFRRLFHGLDDTGSGFFRRLGLRLHIGQFLFQGCNFSLQFFHCLCFFFVYFFCHNKHPNL
ncbi:unknown [Megasphaera elsdenii CAG:570]|uniref:Uncharacterized protein n=1 Tax=Megasphaera elsdenii CAG:570 TaxID=1263087 RepID=R7MWX0_MEGEL|nr:unknown [Megasphaera elsdenii CAG:570]